MSRRLKTAGPDILLDKRWVVYDPLCWKDKRKHGSYGVGVEDLCIITDDGFEVVGCSEWMRADREVFEHIVKLHNEQLKQEKGGVV